MKYILVLSLVIPAAVAQTGTASITGTVLDAQTLKPVPAALVLAVRNGPPAFTRNSRSGGDGAFQIQGLAAGRYSLCVQAQGDLYLDPCQWNGSPATVTLVSGQAAAGIPVRLTTGSLLKIQVRDAQKVLSATTRDGRRPEVTLGVWGPNGLYYPVRAPLRPGAGIPSSAMEYRMAVPRDTPLKLHIASHDVQLGDASGRALSGNAGQEIFQHASGDLNPRSFAFTVLGLLP